MNKKEVLKVINNLTEYRALSEYEAHFEITKEDYESEDNDDDKEKVIDVDLLIKKLGLEAEE